MNAYVYALSVAARLTVVAPSKRFAEPFQTLSPTEQEILDVLTPLEEQEERDYEEMLCALYESRGDITDSFDDRPYWI